MDIIPQKGRSMLFFFASPLESRFLNYKQVVDLTLPTVFRRYNDEKTKARTNELDNKYDQTKGKKEVVVLEPCFRRCQKLHVDFTDSIDLDLHLSEAPSMTACGQLKKDRSYIQLPNDENLFLLYNRYQEEGHLAVDDEDRTFRGLKDKAPIVIIPESNVKLHSRCMLVRKNSAGEAVDLLDGDLEKASAYFLRMQL